MQAPSRRYRRKGPRMMYIRRVTVAEEVCEATFGVAVTRRTLHRLRSMPEGHGLPVHLEKVLVTNLNEPCIARSSVYRYERSFDHSSITRESHIRMPWLISSPATQSRSTKRRWRTLKGAWSWMRSAYKSKSSFTKSRGNVLPSSIFTWRSSGERLSRGTASRIFSRKSG